MGWFQTLFGEYKDPQCALWTVFCNDSISEVATAPCLLWIVCFRRGLEVGYDVGHGFRLSRKHPKTINRSGAAFVKV